MPSTCAARATDDEALAAAVARALDAAPILTARQVTRLSVLLNTAASTSEQPAA